MKLIVIGKRALQVERDRRALEAIEHSGARQHVREARRKLSASEADLADAVADALNTEGGE